MNAKEASVPPCTKKLQAKVTVTAKIAGKKTPKGAEELLSSFLTCSGYGNRSFRATMLPKGKPGSPGRQGKVSVSTKLNTHSVGITAQTGGNDTCMVYVVETPDDVVLSKFHEQLLKTEKPFNRHGNTAGVSFENEDSKVSVNGQELELNASNTIDSSGPLRNIANDETIIGLYLQSLQRLFGQGRIPKGCTVNVIADPKSGLQEYQKNSLKAVARTCSKHGYLEMLYYKGGTSTNVSGYLLTKKALNFLGRLEGTEKSKPINTPEPVSIELGDIVPAKLREKIEPYLATVNAHEQCKERLAEAQHAVKTLEKELSALDAQLQDPQVQKAVVLFKQFQDLEKELDKL